jgi:hypothetical protein
MHMTRRAALRGSVMLAGAAALAGCDLTLSNSITLGEQLLTDIDNFTAGLASIKGLVPAAAQAIITNAIAMAQKVLGSVAPGGLVPLTSIQNVFADLEAADAAAAAVLPGNPVVLALGVLLPVIAAAVGMVTPAGAAQGGMTVATARSILQTLPRPASDLSPRPPI